MSHRSRLAGFIIDCQGGNHDAAADFWSRALGLPRGETHVYGQARYTALLSLVRLQALAGVFDEARLARLNDWLQR